MPSLPAAEPLAPPRTRSGAPSDRARIAAASAGADPANRKWYPNLAASEILVDTMDAMELRFPEPPSDIGSYEIPDVWHSATPAPTHQRRTR